MTAVLPTVLSDPGGVRPIVARWTITADLVLQTATHLGGGAGDIADMVLIRDARTGAPLLPGPSIAGALRSHLADVIGGYRSAEDARLPRLFGAARGDDVGGQSPLIVFDSLGSLPDHHAAEVRDGVQVDAARGTAEEHKKFDLGHGESGDSGDTWNRGGPAPISRSAPCPSLRASTARTGMKPEGTPTTGPLG